MNNKLFAYFDTNPTVAYPIVEGSTYVQTFNEELDSMNIIIDGVKSENRIVLDRPYHFVKILNDVDMTRDQMLESGYNFYKINDNLEELPAVGTEKNVLFDVTTRNFDGRKGLKFRRIAVYQDEEYIEENTCLEFTRDLQNRPRLKYRIDNIHKAVYNNGLLFNNKNYTIMLVDNFVETPMTLGSSPIYKYQIGLMNCIKLLEKIQCPNLVISKSLTGVGKTLWEYIDQYMKLYCPKIKKSIDGINWNYEYLLDWSALEEEPFTNTVVADMQMNEPTLRELLTNLMLQVHCIPYLDYTKVKFINFDEEQSNVVVDNGDGINFITSSGASDSYSNTLIMSPTQTLSDEESIDAELVGFRDSSNAIIRQTENLQIEVRKPIYKINRLLMRSCENIESWPINFFQGKDPGTTGTVLFPTLYKTQDVDDAIDYGGFSFEVHSGGNISFNFRLLYCKISRFVPFISGSLSSLRIHLCKYENDKYTEVGLINPSAEWNIQPISQTEENRFKGYRLNSNGTITEDSNLEFIILTKYTQNYVFSGITQVSGVSSSNDLLSKVSHIWIEYKFNDIKAFLPMTAIKRSVDDVDYFYADIKGNFQENTYDFDILYPADTPMSKLRMSATKGPYVDLTPLVYENKRRQLLDVDYTQMNFDANSTLEDLGKFIYGSLGYTIGDNKITGFSNTYKYGTWWLWDYVDKEKSYFDLIIEFLSTRTNLVQLDLNELLTYEAENIQTYLSSIYGNYAQLFNKDQILYIDEESTVNNWLSTSYPKMKYLFYINYQPLENIKLRLSKENKDAPHLIEQLNQSGDGLSDFERLLLHNQENSNRIGNVVKSIPQTTRDIQKIKPLNGLYGKYTIFRREFSIYQKYISVNYTASEEYVLKNYFTSIITKYRAYQYIDYNEAIERKENTIIYGMISADHYYNGDDKIKIFDTVYSFDDLANSLNITVADLKSNYINYTESGNKVFSMRNKVQFNITDDNKNKSPTLYSKENIIVDYRTGSTQINIESSSTTDPTHNTIALYMYIGAPYDIYERFLRNWNSAWNESMVYNGEVKNLRDFMDEEFSGAFESDLYDENSILKTDGFILKDTDNDKYYVIHISNEKQFVALSTVEQIDSYEYLNNLFQELHLRTTEMLGLYGPFVKYFTNGYIEIGCVENRIKIYLEEVTYEQVANRLTNQKPFRTVFLSGLDTWENGNRRKFKINLEIEESENEYGNIEEVKNECSAIAYKNGLVFNYQNFDNVSAGPTLYSLEPELTNNYAVSGIVQKWQIWNQEVYNESHNIKFCYSLSLNSNLISDSISEYVKKLPIITLGWVYKPYELFEVVNGIYPNEDSYTFYKDYAEYLNHTIQFEYYAPDGDIIFDDNLFKANRMVANIVCEQIYLCKVSEDKFGMKSYEYDAEDVVEAELHFDYDDTVKLPYIQIPWNLVPYGTDYIMLVGLFNEQYYNLMGIKRNDKYEQTKYYLTLNDTKTNDVWYFTDEEDLFTVRECDNGINRYLKND